MRSGKKIPQNCLYFSCWSKKGYSIFAGLGREIRISRLATSMYENVLLKSALHGLIINTDSTSEVIPLLVQIVASRKFDGKNKGEVCANYSSINKIYQKGYMQKAIYPFFHS